MESPNPPYGSFVPRGRSRLAADAARLPIRVRLALGIDDYVIALLDSLVTLCAIVEEDTGTPLLERLEAAEAEFPAVEGPVEWITDGLNHLSGPTLADWVDKLSKPDRRKVLNRALGAATYNTLREGLREDARIVLTAIQRGTEFLQPWAVVIDDAISTLTADQRRELAAERLAGMPLIEVVISIDALVGTTLQEDLRLSRSGANRARPMVASEVEVVRDQVRAVVRTRSDENMTRLSRVLLRKIRGARDALQYSEDGVSQAANSLVELIDRLAREAFSEEEVLRWIDENGLDPRDHIYLDLSGHQHPTKRAQLLCLAWAGGPVRDDPEAFNIQKLAAFALLNVRNQLQKLKHADEAIEEEMAMLYSLLCVIEGTTTLIVRGCWALAEPGRLGELRSRLSA